MMVVGKTLFATIWSHIGNLWAILIAMFWPHSGELPKEDYQSVTQTLQIIFDYTVIV